MTRLYLAWSPQGDETLARHAGDGPVDLLVAYPELRGFMKRRHRYNVRSWFLDSGAFGVFNSGKTIDLAEYIAVCKSVDADEIAGLDVIGDADATRRNLDRMWSAGVPAIPTFHRGSPESDLKWCCDHAPKIALGGVAKAAQRARRDWVAQCFARIWPKAVHGFGIADHANLALVPFHSCDATSWLYAPSAMGAYAGFTGKQISLKSRGIKDFWCEVLEHRKRAARAAVRWRAELAQLGTLAPVPYGGVS